MRQVSFVAITAGLALLVGGCGLFGGGDTTTQSPTASPSVAPTTVAVSPTASPEQQTPFAQPTVSPQANAPRGLLPPDLISSTDSNQRVRQIQSNRSDPFSLIPTTPSVQLPPPVVVPTAPAPTANPLPAPRQAASPNRSNSSPGVTRGSGSGQSGQRSSGNGGRLAPIPNLVPRTGLAPTTPPPPQPDLARAVKVTGVVQVGNQLYAIVDAPNEPSSRYVQVGQRLSNGQILVRRIDMTGAEPRVVLEQYGIEVVRAVGEGGTPAAAPGTSPAAALPTNPPRG
jgi:hypothetical protein